MAATDCKGAETGRSRGFAFVEFSTDEAAQSAIATFNDFELDGRKLRVNAAEDRPPRRERGRGIGGERVAAADVGRVEAELAGGHEVRAAFAAELVAHRVQERRRAQPGLEP